MRYSLRTKILLLITGTVLGVTGLGMAVITSLARQEVSRLVRMDVRSAGGALAQLMRERTQSLKDQSRLLASQPLLKAYLQSRDRASINDIAHDFQKQIHADGAVITDRDGLLLGESSVTISASPDRSADAGVKTALDGRTWSGVIHSGGRMFLGVAVPIVIGPEVWGTFTAYSAIDTKLAAGLKAGLSGSEIAFVRGGRVIGSSVSTPSQLPVSHETPTTVTLNGQPYLALYAPLPDTGDSANMGFVILRPGGSADSPFGRTGAIFELLSGGLVLLALVAGVFVGRSITRPLEGVVRAAGMLRRGEWPERFETKRSDEIGLLQTVFNEMTVAMRADQERLLALIDTDPLTGLDNHRRFQERLAQEATRCAGSGEALSLLLLDLDHFQEYNQKHGHSAGDEALQRVGVLLMNCLPEVAITARYAGDKFAVLLPQHDLDSAEGIGDKLREMFWNRGPRDGAGEATASTPDVRSAELSLSAGCAQFGDRTVQADTLVLAAELAVSQAKQLGRNRTCRFDSVPGAYDTTDPGQLHRFVKDGSLSTIQALAAAVDAKDSYTNGHSQRVADYATRLAEHVGLPPSVVELVYITGTLHDVGKIGVPDAVLTKPGRLTDEERAVMETHPVMGELIVRKAPQLAVTLPGVRHHHERWDGKGYPDNLTGEQIPHIARILAVADTFDAMTSDRPYRKGMDWEVALAEIAKGAGTQFDPELAPAFVEMIRGGQAERRKAA